VSTDRGSRVLDAPLAPFDYAAFTAAIQSRFRELLEQVDELAPRYQGARPFPYIVMDDFLPADIAEEIYAEFPAPHWQHWTALPTDDQKGKFVTTDEGVIPSRARALIHELNSGTFLHYLERLTGVPQLISDTKLIGGGLHRIERGGKLSVHIDFSHHPYNGLNRRLNLLLYLNKDWKGEYGGRFELWDRRIERAEASFLPLFNRCAVFSTSPISYHGHPEPLMCPPGEARKSIALYYFSVGRPADEDVEHNTLFRSRPGDPFSLSNTLIRAASSGLFRDLVPPLVYRTARRLWNSRYVGK
jgi:hypothetical protein